MSRRIDVELTSDRGDGSWTWRAAGAKQPKGVVEASLLPAGTKVGDVLRAEADFDLDGVTIVATAPVQDKKRNEAERIEIIGRPRRDDELVTSSLVKGGRGDRRERGPRDRGPREGRPGDRGDRGPRRTRRDGERGDRGERRERGERGPGPEREGEGRGDRGRPRDVAAGDGRPERGERSARPSGRRPPRPRPEEPPKPKAKRLRAGRAHRTALLDELPPEHRPIAEQVLAGDMPAVRQAIDKENAARKERGETAIDGKELLALAERLRPRLRTAEWHDRADAALADVDEIDLRDLRSVVVAADSAARDEETRALAAQLREALARRVDHEQTSWLHELTAALDSGRAVRALRLSSRPPKAGTILEPALTARLTEAASASLTADAPADRWGVVLEAVAFSPVRLAVVPQSRPDAPSEELLGGVRRFAGRVPKVAAAFGIEATAADARPRGPRKAVPPPPPRAEGTVTPEERDEKTAAEPQAAPAAESASHETTVAEPQAAPAAENASLEATPAAAPEPTTATPTDPAAEPSGGQAEQPE